MSSSVTVQVFNANTQAMKVNINNGTTVSVPGTGASNNWVPQQANNTPWKFSPGFPAPDTIGLGAPNPILLNVPNVITAQTINVTVPTQLQIQALQLYIFFGTMQTVSWVLLSGGMIIGNGTSLPGLAVAKPKKPAGKKGGGASKGGSKGASKRR